MDDSAASSDDDADVNRKNQPKVIRPLLPQPQAGNQQTPITMSSEETKFSRQPQRVAKLYTFETTPRESSAAKSSYDNDYPSD